MDPDARLAPERVDAFVVAGGRSRRMGTDKARLLWNGEPLVRGLATRLGPRVARVWLVAKPDSGLEDLGLPMLYDTIVEPALVHGIATALRASGAEWRWLLACDMPGVDATVLDALWDSARRAGAPGSYPQRGDRNDPEPLPSLWHRDVAERIAPDWGMEARQWLRRAGLAAWPVPDAELGGLVNLNTPLDWGEWRCRAELGDR